MRASGRVLEPIDPGHFIHVVVKRPVPRRVDPCNGIEVATVDRVELRPPKARRAYHRELEVQAAQGAALSAGNVDDARSVEDAQYRGRLPRPRLLDLRGPEARRQRPQWDNALVGVRRLQQTFVLRVESPVLAEIRLAGPQPQNAPVHNDRHEGLADLQPLP